jgi:hypothetical protein
MDFKQYLTTDNKDDLDAQLAINLSTSLSPEMANKIQLEGSKLKLTLQVYAEIFCPDCRIAIALLLKMQEIAPQLKIEIRPRTGNEEELRAITKGAPRIPTIIYNSQPLLLEYPRTVATLREKQNTEQSRQTLVEWRKGQFNDDFVNQILEGIAKSNL